MTSMKRLNELNKIERDLNDFVRCHLKGLTTPKQRKLGDKAVMLFRKVRTQQFLLNGVSHNRITEELLQPSEYNMNGNHRNVFPESQE